MSFSENQASAHGASLPGHRLPAAGKLTDGLLAAAIGAVSLFYLWPFRSVLAFLDPDEGILLQGAARILRGELPYRDFFSFYTPGSYYWDALWMRVFGDSILVPRTIVLLYGVLFSVMTFVLARKMASRTGAVLAALALLSCCLPVRFLVLHNWDNTAAALLALYFALGFLQRPGLRSAAAIGFLTGLAVLFNQARGMGLLLGLFVGFLALRSGLHSAGARPRDFLAMGAAFTLPLGITAAFFAAQGGLNAMVQCLLWAPRHYSEANRLPYGYITMPITGWVELFDTGPLYHRGLNYFILSPVVVICALPVALLLIAVACRWKPRADLEPAQVATVIFSGAVVAGSLLSVAATRADFHHVTFITPLFFFLLPWVAERWMAPFTALRKLAPLAAVYLLIAFTAYGMALLWPVRATVQLETRRGPIRIQQRNETLEYVQARFPAGSPLLVHPYLPLYSFLTRTFSPLPYDYLQPGMHTREQFEEGVTRLKALRPAVVLYEPDFVGKVPTAWPRTPLARMVEDPVADYLLQNYRSCVLLDRGSPAPFLVMVRKDLSCSDYR